MAARDQSPRAAGSDGSRRRNGASTNGSGQPRENGTRPAAARASARREREREIVDATRALFDERGVQDAPIEEIARAVGINKALIYRHFASKEELYVVTVTRYLSELAESFAEVDESLDPSTQLRQVSERYVQFCLRYPAFVDCALSLMRRPIDELSDTASPAVLLQLGQSMSACLSRLSRVLAAGAQQGVFDVEDPDLIANHLYASGLGAMHLARIGIGVRELAPGVPQMFPVDPADVARLTVEMAFAAVLSPQRAD